MTTFAGRVEAKFTIPASTSVSVSNSGGGPTTSTVAAGSYFMTAAGGVTGFISTLQSQLNTDRPPSVGTWTVSLSTSTGQVSIGCDNTTAAIPSFAVVWTSTTERDLLGFTRDIDYASTAAQLAADIGYGTWTGADFYLCNEASGNIAPVFGANTLTAGGTPTYSLTGPRGGSDRAIKLDSAPDYFSGATTAVNDVGATDDLIILWVGKFTALTGSQFTRIAAKSTFGSGGGNYQVGYDATVSGLSFSVGDASSHAATATAGTGSATTNWQVGVAVLERATNMIRIGSQDLVTSTRYLSAQVSASTVGSLSNTASFTLGGFSSADWTVAAFGVCKGSGVATGLSANLGTALANLAATFGTWTGTKQARGVWLPDSPLFIDGNSTTHAPLMTDQRITVGPTGTVYGLVGNARYEQASLSWKYVDKSRTWEANATTSNASWEQFLKDTQYGLGLSVFSVCSPVQIYDNASNRLGSDVTMAGWTILGVDSITPKRTDARGYDGFWTIEIPRLVSSR